MSLQSKMILDELMAAYVNKREFPYTIQRGAVTIMVEDKVDLILNIEAFRRITEQDNAQVKGELMGVMTR